MRVIASAVAGISTGPGPVSTTHRSELGAVGAEADAGWVGGDAITDGAPHAPSARAKPKTFADMLAGS